MTTFATSSVILLLLIGSSVVGALYFFGVMGSLFRNQKGSESEYAERTAELLDAYHRHQENEQPEQIPMEL